MDSKKSMNLLEMKTRHSISALLLCTINIFGIFNSVDFSQIFVTSLEFELEFWIFNVNFEWKFETIILNWHFEFIRDTFDCLNLNFE